MHVVAIKTLKTFWAKHPDAEQALLAWYDEVSKDSWKQSSEIKLHYPSASILKNRRVVFNIKGNDYRLIVAVAYKVGVVYVKVIGTHRCYVRRHLRISANEWRAGVCEKPRIRCGDCSNRLLIPLSDAVIYDQLAGEHTVGVYPLLENDSCHFLATDFDEADWREDARAYMQSCEDLGVPVAMEISRSGQGAHAWVFFASRVSARDARRLGTAVISHTCSRTRQLKLESYDRLFPNQDTMPKGGFGNLIALPLQKRPRESGCSVFVDAELHPYPDQWAFLASVRPMAVHDIEPTILRATGGVHPLDVTFIDDEDLATPWKRECTSTKKLAGPMPKSLSVTQANLIDFEKAQLPQALANRLIRLAAFQNPEFYKAQAMRMSVWDKPRVIGNAGNYPQHIALPRGCLDAALDLLRANGIACNLRDDRFGGDPIDVSFVGTLRLDQEAAVEGMLHNDAGVLCAPTAFGKQSPPPR